MPTRLMRRLYRERRRVALIVALVFAGLRLAGPAALAPPLPAAACALAVGALAAVVGVLRPRLRGGVEALALAGLAFAALARALPGGTLDLAAPGGDAPVAVAVGLGLVVLALAARRSLVALPLPRLHSRRFTARAGTRVDIYRLWYGLVPTPGQTAHGGDPDLDAVGDMSLRLGRVRLLGPTMPQPRRATHLQILDMEAPFHIQMRGRDGDRRGVMGASGISEIFLVDLGPRRLVLFSHTFSDMPLGRALLAWLDDAPGRRLDRRLALIERQARSEDPDGARSRPRPAGATALCAWADDAARDTPAAAEDESGDAAAKAADRTRHRAV